MGVHKLIDGVTRITIVGTFYPRFQNAGNSTTGIAIVLSALPERIFVRIYCQFGGRLPASMTSSRTQLFPTWTHDDSVSLIRTFVKLLFEKSSTNLYFFNSYPRSFGRSRLANAIGLLMPIALKIFRNARVVVYMHNMVRTQNLDGLGYRAQAISAHLGALIESLLIETTDVVIPLRTQRDRLPERLRSRVRVVPLNYIEAASTVPYVCDIASPTRCEPTAGTRSCLLIGNWGPQKDLERVVREFIKRPQGTLLERLTVVGGFNTGFPEYAQRLSRLSAEARDARVTFTGLVPDEQLPSIFAAHNVLLLPYLAAGGYSGAMNLGAAFGMKIVAYDLEELREQSEQLHIKPSFVPVSDAKALLNCAFDGAIEPTHTARDAVAAAMALAVKSVRALFSQEC